MSAQIIIIAGTLALAVVGIVLIWIFFLHEKKEMQKRSDEMKRQVVQATVLTELTKRIGYTFDVEEIIEVISGSLRNVISYKTVSYLLYDEEDDEIRIKIDLDDAVSDAFLEDVRRKIKAAYVALVGKDIPNIKIEEQIVGAIPNNANVEPMRSFFNLPLVIGGTVVGLINIASTEEGLYTGKETEVLYAITNLASTAVFKLSEVLKNEQNRMNSMVASLASGLIMIDQQDKVVAINPEASKILGLENAQKVRLLEIIESLKGKVDLLDALEQKTQSSEPVVFSSIEMMGRYYKIIVSPVFDNGGGLLGSVLLFYDLTTEIELQRMREEFTAMMVHELRAPLTSVRWGIEALLSEETPAQELVAEQLGMIDDVTAKMLVIVNDLLDVSKIEAGKFEISLNESSLQETIHKTVEVFLPQAKEKNVVLTEDVPADLPAFSFDPVRIGQVITNLISNALKFTEQGSIVVHAAMDTENGKVRVSVTDTGAGIPAEDLSKLFAKYVQLGGSKEKKKGTGLGLSIVKGIVEAHGGQVGVESEVGKGTTFWFELPLKQDAKK